uniref:Clusterin n=1 Tax=Bos indicus x Bos taurus TaxID=30522 RepID=A0A4W2IBB4_BOBOX
LEHFLLQLVRLLLQSPRGRLGYFSGCVCSNVCISEQLEMSTEGSKYEVKQIRTQIEQTNEERKLLHSSLEEAKKKKENPLNDTRDSETKLKASQGVCKKTTTALWDECKPCLKQICMKFYAPVCRSGSGLVGHQVTRRPAPSAQHVSGRGMRTEYASLILHRVPSVGISLPRGSPTPAGCPAVQLKSDPIYLETASDPTASGLSPTSLPHHAHPRFQPPIMNPGGHLSLTYSFSYLEPVYCSMSSSNCCFLTCIQISQEADQVVWYSHLFQNFPHDRTVCKEIRHNSTGCLWMEEQCEKCQEILGVDCSASNPTQTLLRQQLNESLQLAEKFSRLYNQLLQSYQQKLLNTSALLKQLNEQFTWVSQLANLTQNDDQYHLQVSMVSLECSDPSIPSGLTKVAVKLFNSFPITVTVPQEVSSPDFMENAVEKALQRYRQRSP